MPVKSSRNFNEFHRRSDDIKVDGWNGTYSPGKRQPLIPQRSTGLLTSKLPPLQWCGWNANRGSETRMNEWGRVPPLNEAHLLHIKPLFNIHNVAIIEKKVSQILGLVTGNWKQMKITSWAPPQSHHRPLERQHQSSPFPKSQCFGPNPVWECVLLPW